MRRLVCVISSALVAAAVGLSGTPAAGAVPQPTRPTASAVIDTPCRPAQANKTLKDKRGRLLVCAEEFGRHTWRVAPDAVARKAHAGFLQLARSLQAKHAANAATFQVIQEPGFPKDLADAILAAANLGVRTVGEVDPGSPLILAVTPGFMHATARRLADPCWNAVTEDSRQSWLLENDLPVRQQQYQGFGHAGVCSNVFFAFLNKEKPYFEHNTAPVVAEGFLREFMIQAKALELIVPSTQNGGKPPCWEAESRAWNLTWALMEQARIPGYSFNSRWAHWVSDLAGARGSYQPGLAASERWINAANGDIRYDMPCQANPGIGHIQGALAREWLMATAGPAAYEAYPLVSQRTGEMRQSLLESTGVAMDSWIAAADARTTSLLAKYPASHHWIPRLP